MVIRKSALEKVGMTFPSVSPEFWKGKTVFLTGHTGFKGGWLSLWLASMGAKVTGYALAPNTNPNLFDVLGVQYFVENSFFADIRDLEVLKNTMVKVNPEIVIHMAAQPLVRHSYANPVETYATNVMGTVNVLEAVRSTPAIRSVVVVTTDKCYENHEREAGYREDEAMGGFDPYSSSKGCAELVTSAYRRSYFSSVVDRHPAIASARAGNVIGGGDWSEDRLIPDAIKAFESGKALMIRNPLATRPWQHVLEPLSGYLVLAQALYEKGDTFASAWNFGPRGEDARSVQDVVSLLISQWEGDASWEKEGEEQPHEAHFLKLDCSKAKQSLGWTPKWGLEMAMEKIVEWQKVFQSNSSMKEITLKQIDQYTKS
jgi:CDP-glucose 4,6-dehydratase